MQVINRSLLLSDIESLISKAFPAPKNKVERDYLRDLYSSIQVLSYSVGRRVLLYKETLPVVIKNLFDSSHPECATMNTIDGCVLYGDFLESTNTTMHIFDDSVLVGGEGIKRKTSDGSFSKKFKSRVFIRLPDVFMEEVKNNKLLWYLGFRKDPSAKFILDEDIAVLFEKVIRYDAPHLGRVFYYGVY